MASFARLQMAEHWSPSSRAPVSFLLALPWRVMPMLMLQLLLRMRHSRLGLLCR